MIAGVSSLILLIESIASGEVLFFASRLVLFSCSYNLCPDWEIDASALSVNRWFNADLAACNSLKGLFGGRPIPFLCTFSFFKLSQYFCTFDRQMNSFQMNSSCFLNHSLGFAVVTGFATCNERAMRTI